MESFNFGAFDTQLPGRIAAIPQEAEKQRTANMLQAMQVQSAMNQNELAQSQIRTARRAEEGQTLLGKAYGGLDFSGAGTGGVPGQSPFASMKAQVIKSLTASGRADLIPGQLDKLTKMEHEANVNKEIEGKIADQAVKAIDAAYKPFAKNAFSVRNDDNDASITSHHTAMQAHPIIGPIMRTFKTPEQALADDIADIKKPGGLEKWQALNANLDPKELANLVLKVTKRTQNIGPEYLTFSENQLGQQIGPVVRTPIGVSPNTTATLKQQQDHFNSLSAFQKRQLADAGWSFDTDRGIAVNARQGISRPISALIPPSLGGASTAPTVGGAGLSSVATGGGVPGQRQAPAGQPAAGVLGPKPEKPPVEFTKFDNQLSNLVGNLNRFKQEIAKGKTTSAQWAPTGADTATMNAKYIALLMGMKDMYTLGALTGPDLDLIEKQISNPATWGGFTKSREAFNAQIDTIEQQLKDASLNLENSYGHKPKATAAAFSRTSVPPTTIPNLSELPPGTVRPRGSR